MEEAVHGALNTHDAQGLTFDCKPGCGFCCTASPLVLPHEAGPLGALAVRNADGVLRIPFKGPACGSLKADRSCGVYDIRPSVCHLYPYAVHAGRRIQVTVSLACPGIASAEPNAFAELTPDAPPPGASLAQAGARRAAELALAQPGAKENAAEAKATFAEFDRRMKEWGAAAPIEKLRTAILPHLDALAQPPMLPAWFAGLESGELLLEGDASRVMGSLFETQTESDLLDLFHDGAMDAFDEPETVIWVDPDLSWVRARSTEGSVTLMRASDQTIALDQVIAEWDAEASRALAGYLARLLQRDHTEGAAAWLVDASRYQVTPAAAFARVMGEASLQVALRAGLLAAADGRDVIDAAYARRGIMAYETAFHSLPTLGSIL